MDDHHLLISVSVVIYYILRYDHYFPNDKLAIIPISFLTMCGTAPVVDPPAHACSPRLDGEPLFVQQLGRLMWNQKKN